MIAPPNKKDFSCCARPRDTRRCYYRTDVCHLAQRQVRRGSDPQQILRERAGRE